MYVEYSMSSGNARVDARWGENLTSLYLRHRRGNDPSRQEQATWLAIWETDRAGPMPFTYETGPASPYDYWYVKFTTTSGQVWYCKDNFYCSVSPSDDGNVWLRIDGADQLLHVKFSSSSGCTVGLSKQ
jgi:hypothetical protein